MSLTKLPLGRNNSVMTSLFPPRESLVVTSRLGTGNSRTFFYCVSMVIWGEFLPLLPIPLFYCTSGSCSNFNDDISVFSGTLLVYFLYSYSFNSLYSPRGENGDVVIIKVEIQALCREYLPTNPPPPSSVQLAHSKVY
jgi:hypothetical protein